VNDVTNSQQNVTFLKAIRCIFDLMKNGVIIKNFWILKLACLSILTVWLAFPNVSDAQTNYKIGGKPVMNLKGTSTLHDWAMAAHSFTGDANFTLSARKLSAVNKLSLRLPVQNLKGESAGMDKNAYKALKSDKYKDIVFKLTSAKVTPSGGDKYSIVAQGNLTIAGVTKATTLDASAVVNADGTISCSGSMPLYLSSYNIDRPSFALGSMKVADLMTLTYSLVFVK
jgi:polyisoprenoid-binding protein YceI